MPLNRSIVRPLWLAMIAALLLTVAPTFAQFDPNATLPRPTNAQAQIDALPGYLIVNTDNLFLRSGDSPRTEPRAILDGGTRLIVLGLNGRTGDSEWWFVEVGGLRGWVKDSFVIVRGDLRGTPIASPEGVILSPAFYIGVAAPLYDILSPSGEVLCEVPGNRFYGVVATNSAENPLWYKIRAVCNGAAVEGWVYGPRGILRNSADVDVPVLTQ